MKSINSIVNSLNNSVSPGKPATSSSDNPSKVCAICGGEPLCQGLGVIRYQVPIDDPRFGKLFRCPHNPVEHDGQRKEKLRKLSNMEAYADKTFEKFQTQLNTYSLQEQQSLNLAFTSSIRFASAPEGWLLLEGSYGCGKTHLAAAIGNVRLEHGDAVLFITVPDLLDHLRSAYGPSSEVGYDDMFERIRNAPFLILDDLGVENPSAWAQEKLFQLLNHRYVRRLPTVITTNVDPDLLDKRIRSRLMDATLVCRTTISAPDYRSAMQNEHRQLLSNLRPYHEMTFENFDLHTNLTAKDHASLKKVFTAAQTYALAPDGWLVITGQQYGCGKTHLAAAIAIYQQNKGEKVMFITVPDLMDYLRMTYNPDAPMSLDERLQAVRTVPLLILDDLGTENATSWAKEKMFQILDYRYVAQLATVITTSRDIDKELDVRIQSRIRDTRRSKILSIEVPDYSSRLKALHR